LAGARRRHGEEVARDGSEVLLEGLGLPGTEPGRGPPGGSGCVVGRQVVVGGSRNTRRCYLRVGRRRPTVTGGAHSPLPPAPRPPRPKLPERPDPESSPPPRMLS